LGFIYILTTKLIVATSEQYILDVACSLIITIMTTNEKVSKTQVQQLQKQEASSAQCTVKK